MDGFPEVPLVLSVTRRLYRAGTVLRAFREESAFVYQLALVLGMAALTGLAAQVAIPLPFTPVPVTGQVAAVLVAGGLLGRRLGPASQVAYVGLGALGVPWYAPATGASWFSTGGTAILFGVTGGYLLGFIASAAVVGWLTDRGFSAHRGSTHLLVFLLGVGVIYAVGAFQLALVLRLSAPQAVALGVVPFVPGDVLKAVAAAGLLSLVVPPTLDVPGSGLDAAGGRWRRSDTMVLVAILAGVWLFLPWLAGAAGAGPALLTFYVVSATVTTAFLLLALAGRQVLRRAVRSLATG